MQNPGSAYAKDAAIAVALSGARPLQRAAGAGLGLPALPNRMEAVVKVADLAPPRRRASRGSQLASWVYRCHDAVCHAVAGMAMIDRVTGEPEVRLATYGSLAPVRPNHGQLSHLSGRWLVGYVHGALVEAGWGASLGYPGLILDPDEPPIEVHVLESRSLLHHWDRLDAFEGFGDRRVAVDVSTDEGVCPRQSTSWQSRPSRRNRRAGARQASLALDGERHEADIRCARCAK